MCGPSGSERALAGSSSNFASMLQNNFGQLFSGMTNVLSQIGNAFSPIVSAGPSQRGFSGAQTSEMQTEAINTSAAAAKQAAQAARTFGAGQGGGGTSGLTSGISAQIGADIASQGAQQLAGRLGNIEAADWAQGNANYWKAAGGLQSLGSQYENAASGVQKGAIDENANAFGEANTVQQQVNQEQAAIASGITGLAMDVALPGVASMTGSGGGGVSGFMQAFAK